MRSLRCADVLDQRHKTDAGDAERLADLALASQPAVKLLQDDGEQGSSDQEHDQRGENEQDRIRRARPVRRRGKRHDVRVGRHGLLLVPDFLLTAQQRVVELSLGHGLTFEFLQALSGFAGVAWLFCGVCPLLHEGLYGGAGLCNRDLQFRNATLELRQFGAEDARNCSF